MDQKKVLIVDDDPNCSRLVQTMLEKTGCFEVMVENRSRSAVATARTFRPDIMLLDVDMPGKDGGDVACEARADSLLSNVPVVFLTGLLPRSETGDKFVTRGNSRYMSKPPDPLALVELIEDLLRQPA